MRLAELIRLRWLLGVLLIAAAALFAVGIATEGDNHHETIATVESGEHNEATEQAEHNEQTGASETANESLGLTSNRHHSSCSPSSSPLRSPQRLGDMTTN